jgi:ketosteroid isomerase-like protein
MPEAELEVVRRIYAGFRERRLPEEELAPEFEWTSHPELPDAATHRGIREVRRFFADWVAGWAEVRSDVDELIEGEGCVVALIHGSFRLSEGSTPLERDYAHVWTVRDGKARSVRSVDREEALRLVAPR